MMMMIMKYQCKNDHSPIVMLRIVNVVATARLGDGPACDLTAVRRHLEAGHMDCLEKTNGALSISLRPSGKVLLFPSGRVLVTSLSSVSLAKIELARLAKVIQLPCYNFEVKHVVGRWPSGKHKRGRHFVDDCILLVARNQTVCVGAKNHAELHRVYQGFK